MVGLDIFVYMTIGLVIGFLSGRKGFSVHSFQNDGEVYLRREIQRLFRAPDYHLMNHITLKLKDGTTQIDHVLVSRFGIFVVETKDYNGWIFANAKHSFWTQVFFHKKFKFQNPIAQNFRHTQAVRQILDFLPADSIKSAIVFVGEAKFKTEAPIGVFNLSELVRYIQEHTTEIMSHNRMQFCVGRLETARLAITDKTDIEHIESLGRRYRSPP